MSKAEERKRASEAARETRRKVSEAMARLDAGDYEGAYVAAEAAQHAAYDLKWAVDLAQAMSKQEVQA